MLTIAVDMMGGDHGIKVTVPGALHAMLKAIDSKKPSVDFVLVGNEPVIKSALNDLFLTDRQLRKSRRRLLNHLSFVHTDQQIGMDEKPSVALRTKRSSSMRIAVNLVKQGRAQAVVSAGNTGALVAVSRYVLKMFPDIDRPAIVSKIPTQSGHCYMLDLGGNVDTSAKHLLQFAAMGSILATELDHVLKPRVGLLNIGEEDIKGNEQVQQAALLLQKSPWINYCGYIEGDAIYSGDFDVVVCDGFVGNVALKSSEGVARFIMQLIKQEALRSVHRRALALATKPILKAVKRRIDPRQYNGASLVGLKGIVVKSHGGADKFGFAKAIGLAITEADKNIASLIGERLTMVSGDQESDSMVSSTRSSKSYA